ncbi:ABATE domain-containing protein [Streptomyces sp. NPDC001530]|uniref:ABATE domain-containing protein n=1 Tax=Streptomyces sp. NPDC001530 TaxID=3364582 RepID=UPI003699F7CC
MATQLWALAATVGSRRDKPVDLLVAPADLEQRVLECDELPDQVTADVATFTSALQLREAIYQPALDRLRANARKRARIRSEKGIRRAPSQKLQPDPIWQTYAATALDEPDGA